MCYFSKAAILKMCVCLFRHPAPAHEPNKATQIVQNLELQLDIEDLISSEYTYTQEAIESVYITRRR